MARKRRNRGAKRNSQGETQPNPLSETPAAPPVEDASLPPPVATASPPPPPRTSKRELISALAVLLVCASALFAFSVDMRKEHIGTHLQGHLFNQNGRGDNQWISAHTLLTVNNWRAGSPLRNGFAMTFFPPSVETSTLRDQIVYSSYPPGFALPVYWLTFITGKDAGPALLVLFSLASQFLIALCLSFTAFLFLRQSGFAITAAVALAVMPPAVLLFNPMAMYYQVSTYFTDQAVLLPFALFILLEVARDSAAGRSRKALGIVQAAVMFYGVLTDYLFWCVVAVVWLARLWRGRLGESFVEVARRSALFAAPALLAVALFIAQLAARGQLTGIWNKMMFRMAIVPDEIGWDGGRVTRKEDWGEMAAVFWRWHVPEWLGGYAVALVWGSLALLAVGVALSLLGKKPRDRLKHALCLLGCFLLPCVLQVSLLANHSGIHPFSALKFTLPLAMLPPLLPAILWHISARIAPPMAQTTERRIQAALVAVAGAAVLWWAAGLERAHLLKGFPPVNKTWTARGDFIAQHTDYHDVVFSPMWEVKMQPPQQLSFTKKLVYRVGGVDDITRKVENLRDAFTVNVALLGGRALQDTPLRDLAALQPQVIRSGEYTLYKIDGRAFLTSVGK